MFLVLCALRECIWVGSDVCPVGQVSTRAKILCRIQNNYINFLLATYRHNLRRILSLSLSQMSFTNYHFGHFCVFGKWGKCRHRKSGPVEKLDVEMNFNGDTCGYLFAPSCRHCQHIPRIVNDPARPQKIPKLPALPHFWSRYSTHKQKLDTNFVNVTQ